MGGFVRPSTWVAGAAALLWLVAAQSPSELGVIRSGVPWFDTAGHRVYAGGLGMYQLGERFYIVGEGNKTMSDCSDCLNMYSSLDMQSWTFEGCVLKNEDVRSAVPPAFQNVTAYPFYRMERPKVFLCPATKVFTIWFHCDTDGFGLKSVGVLQSTSGLITGPYAFVRECFRPDDTDSYDQGTYYDDPAMPGGDGHMYHVRSVFNSYAGISRMNDNCTDTTGIISGGTPKMEAQALFRDVRGVLHLVGSHETGWGPNAALFLTSPNASLVGAVWGNDYNPSGSGSTWNSQSTFMFPYRHPDGHVTHIWMADEWNMWGPGSIQNFTNIWLPFSPPTGPVPQNPQSGWMVSLKPCDASDPLQHFQYGGGGKDTVTHVGSGLCIAQPSPALSSQSGGIGVLTCDGTPSQQWYFVGDAFSNTTSGFGADCVNWNAGNGDELGAAIILYRCGNETQWNSRWDVPAAAGVPGTFEALSDATRTGFCLAVAPSPDPSLWGLPWRDAWQLKDF